MVALLIVAKHDYVGETFIRAACLHPGVTQITWMPSASLPCVPQWASGIDKLNVVESIEPRWTDWASRLEPYVQKDTSIIW